MLDKKSRVLLIIVLMLVAIVAAGVSISVLTSSSGNRGLADESDPNDANANSGGTQASPTDAPGIFLATTPAPETSVPSSNPSQSPSSDPSALPSVEPTMHPSLNPSSNPTLSPSDSPSSLPSSQPSPIAHNCNRSNSAVCRITIFYAIADAPYTDVERAALPDQVLQLPNNAEFLIHLGDIRSARESSVCRLEEYTYLANLLRTHSSVPVFMVVGDNEFNDCSNVDAAWGFWMQELAAFEDYWDHDFTVMRPQHRPENFAFVHKQSLFIGLNLVGGRVHDPAEWTARLTEQVEWTKSLMTMHTNGDAATEQVRAVVIFGHANPNTTHELFFGPLKVFIRDVLTDTVPVLYMNGDAHVWSYDSSYLGVDQFLRIQLTGGTAEPPLQVIVAPSEAVGSTAQSVFLYDRRL